MVCKKCGKEINANAKFCMYCGNLINKETINENEKNNKVDKRLKEYKHLFKDKDINNDTKNKSNKRRLKLMIIILAVVIVIVMLNIDAGVNLKRTYNKVLNQDPSYSRFMSLASDYSYIAIDTNPNDKDDYYSAAATKLVQAMNKELGFSESLYNKMIHTRSLDGKQSDEANGIEVTWTYHPDDGLEIQYTKMK